MKSMSFSSRIITTTAIMLTVIVVSGFSIFYYYSYSRFATNFEDYTIDEHTTSDYLKKGVKNEWVLGVTAHSIDLVQAIHGDNVAEHLLKEAEEQVEEARFYREQVDGKYLFYRINVDIENGERIYKYSIIKDIYLEQIPNIIKAVIIVFSLIFISTYYLLKKLTEQLTCNLDDTSGYLKRVASGELDIKIDHSKIYNKNMHDVIDSFEFMQNKLKDQKDLQESILQYISHEVKTPIMIINCYTQAAKDSESCIDEKELYDVVLQQTDRISKKVNQLLLSTKVDVDFTTGNKEILNVKEVFDTVYNQVDFINKKLEKKVDIDPKLYIYGYRDNFQVLFENMLINCYKYAKTKVSIFITAKDDKVIINFINDSEKIKTSELKQIFKPFVKGEKGGTGLGLAIVKKIVLLHHGQIYSVSKDDYTCFQIVLPKAE